MRLTKAPVSVDHFWLNSTAIYLEDVEIFQSGLFKLTDWLTSHRLSSVSARLQRILFKKRIQQFGQQFSDNLQKMISPILKWDCPNRSHLLVWILFLVRDGRPLHSSPYRTEGRHRGQNASSTKRWLPNKYIYRRSQVKHIFNACWKCLNVFFKEIIKPYEVPQLVNCNSKEAEWKCLYCKFLAMCDVFVVACVIEKNNSVHLEGTETRKAIYSSACLNYILLRTQQNKNNINAIIMWNRF